MSLRYQILEKWANSSFHRMPKKPTVL